MNKIDLDVHDKGRPDWVKDIRCPECGEKEVCCVITCEFLELGEYDYEGYLACEGCGHIFVCNEYPDASFEKKWEW